MAFESRDPVVVAFPPFRGVTRRILLIAGAVFLVHFIGRLFTGGFVDNTLNFVALNPESVLRGMVWMLGTYPFVETGSLLNLLLVGFSIWTIGSMLEEDRGSRWFAEYFFATTIGGGILTVLLSLALRGIPGIGPHGRVAGLWPLTMTTLIAFAWFYPRQELRFMFLVRIQARHLAMVYLVGYVFYMLLGGDRMATLAVLTNCACGWLFLRFAPRKGLRYAASESWYGLRNAFYRRKRRQAAKKFEVYMRQHGKDVSVKDDEKNRWMN